MIERCPCSSKGEDYAEEWQGQQWCVVQRRKKQRKDKKRDETNEMRMLRWSVESRRKIKTETNM